MREIKNNALNKYREARKAYLENKTNDNWIKFCNAKRECMLLGIRL